jgi:hypothetical protein
MYLDGKRLGFGEAARRRGEHRGKHGGESTHDDITAASEDISTSSSIVMAITHPCRIFYHINRHLPSGDMVRAAAAQFLKLVIDMDILCLLLLSVRP